jgi:predicted O-methyltransferase YrrM
MDNILLEYKRGDYELLKEKIKKNMNGRQCHHKVVINTILANLYNLENYLEIGVHNGTSMSYFISSKNAKKAYGIDLFEETIQRYYHDKLTIVKSKENISKNNSNNCEIELIKGNSTHLKTLENIKKLEILFDLLFIDGDHEYNGVKNDFINYSPFVKKDGFIVIDDYEPSYEGIMRFVEEHFKNNNDYKIIGVFEKNELIIQKLTS